MEEKKKKSWRFYIVSGILLLVVLIIVISSLGKLFLSPSFLLTLGSKIPKFANSLFHLEEKGNTYTAQSDEGSAELFVPDNAFSESQIITLRSVDKTDWPINTIGGLFELNTNNKPFDKGLVFKMTLNKNPEKHFFMGFWDPETKSWEKLPTVWKGGLTYETILPHASFPGGYSADLSLSEFAEEKPSKSSATEFNDRENQSTFLELKAELKKIEIDQLTGEAAPENDACWERAWQIMDELANKLIADYCKNKSLQNKYNFYVGWETAQLLPFSTIANRFSQAIEFDCGKKQKTADYTINQIDRNDFKGGLKAPGNIIDFQIDTSYTERTISNGNPVNTANVGKAGWKCDWKVYQAIIGTSEHNGQMFAEERTIDSHFLLDFPYQNVKGYSGDSWLYSFSLEKVKEGETFPVQAERFGEYSMNLAGPRQNISLIDLQDGQGINKQFQYTPSNNVTEAAGATKKLIGTLLEDNGKDGAVIVFASQEFTDQQKGQLQEGMAAINQMGGFEKMGFDSNAIALLEKAYNGETGMKPLRIVPTN